MNSEDDHLLPPSLVLGMSVSMPDLASLDDITYFNTPRVTMCHSAFVQLDQFTSPATETKHRRSKNNLHVLTNRTEPGLQLTSSSTPLGGQQHRIEGSITELVKWTMENVPKPPQSSFLDGLRYTHGIVVAIADCLT
ncbi:unnamed protein product [Schistocephalus solidus]|uniref:Uncharacterized protein n=1 Tax=Schistocephalus solidus TaxID=70667 RepID=A0A183T0K9_SCHSO|nr:unnamed protein product [Schistocephalus solidus]